MEKREPKLNFWGTNGVRGWYPLGRDSHETIKRPDRKEEKLTSYEGMGGELRSDLDKGVRSRRGGYSQAVCRTVKSIN